MMVLVLLVLVVLLLLLLLVVVVVVEPCMPFPWHATDTVVLLKQGQLIFV